MECVTCKYWYSAGMIGQCRRHAPVKLEVSGTPTTTWPDTAAHDWCGDYEDKRQTPPQYHPQQPNP